MKFKLLNFLEKIFLLLIILPALISAQSQTLNVLFVGNSYTASNNLPHIVSLISDKTDTKLITRKSTAGGAHLWEHWNGDRGLKTKEIIAGGEYDIVILQDYSMSAIDTPDSTVKYVKMFKDYIDTFGAETYLYNTWAREKVPQFQEVIDSVYRESAELSGAAIVPVGAAWHLARQLRPTANLFTADGSHPSTLGTFLTAVVFVAELTGEIPDTLPKYYNTKDSFGESVSLMYQDNLDIIFCLKIAEEIFVSR